MKEKTIKPTIQKTENAHCEYCGSSDNRFTHKKIFEINPTMYNEYSIQICNKCFEVLIEQYKKINKK